MPPRQSCGWSEGDASNRLGIEMGNHIDRNLSLVSGLKLAVYLWQLVGKMNINHAAAHGYNGAAIAILTGFKMIHSA